MHQAKDELPQERLYTPIPQRLFPSATQNCHDQKVHLFDMQSLVMHKYIYAEAGFRISGLGNMLN